MGRRDARPRTGNEARLTFPLGDNVAHEAPSRGLDDRWTFRSPERGGWADRCALNTRHQPVRAEEILVVALGRANYD